MFKNVSFFTYLKCVSTKGVGSIRLWLNEKNDVKDFAFPTLYIFGIMQIYNGEKLKFSTQLFPASDPHYLSDKRAGNFYLMVIFKYFLSISN